LAQAFFDTGRPCIIALQNSDTTLQNLHRMRALVLWLAVLSAILPHAVSDLKSILDAEMRPDDDEDEGDDGFSVEVENEKESSRAPAAKKVQSLEVPELDEDTFDEWVIRHPYAIVKFYYKDDERCQEFVGPMEEAAAIVAKRNPQHGQQPVFMAQVDAREQQGLTDMFGLNVVSKQVMMPTFHAFAFGMHQRYFSIHTRPLTVEAIVQKAAQVTVDAAKEQNMYIIEPGDKSMLWRYRESTRKTDVAILFYGYKNSAKTLTFKKAVKDFIGPYKDVCKIRCAIVNVSKADGIKMSMWRPGFTGTDAMELDYTGKWDAIAISRWAKKNTYPTIGHKFSINKYGWSAMKELFLEASVVVVLGEEAVGLEACKASAADGVCASEPKVLGEETSSQGGTSAVRSQLTQAFQDISGKYPLWRFVITTAAEVSASELDILGWRNNSDTMVTVLKDKRRYVLTDQEQLQSQFGLQDWLAEVSSGYVPPTWKTEALEVGEPTENADGILVLRGDTFEEYALDPAMDVLVLFTHTGCQVCEDVIEPVMRELDKRLEEQLWKSGVVLAKFDALKNECMEDVPTVPKLVIYPAVELNKKMKSRQIYPGLFELEPLTEFLVKYSKNIEEAHWFEKKKGKNLKAEEKILKEKNVPQDRRRRTPD